MQASINIEDDRAISGIDLGLLVAIVASRPNRLHRTQNPFTEVSPLSQILLALIEGLLEALGMAGHLHPFA